jgi:hypothetical protein
MRRRGGIPPLVTVLVTIASIVAASLVAWFMFATSRSATQQPLLEVTDAYTDGTNLVFTVRNLGTQSVNLGSFTVSCANPGSTASVALTPQGCSPSTADPGKSVACRATVSSGALQDGASCVVTFSGTGTSHGFKVVRP